MIDFWAPSSWLHEYSLIQLGMGGFALAAKKSVALDVGHRVIEFGKLIRAVVLVRAVEEVEVFGGESR